jgi:uncharacterized protein
MKYKKIVLAGGSGFIGQHLCRYFHERAEEIVVLSRGKERSTEFCRIVHWDGEHPGPWTKELEGCDLLINLSGRNVNCRYNQENQEEILKSRLQPTRLLGNVIGRLQRPPSTWINMTSATIYRHAEDRPQDEETGEHGSGFSVDVCTRWENAFRECITPGTRKIILRAAIVLGREDGLIPRLKNLVRLGMGGKQGTGKQYVSWIHEQDLARIIEWVAEKGEDGSVFNAAAPGAIQNKDLMEITRETYGMPVGLPMPQWLLEFGAILIGTETELILKSRWVYPGKLLKEGFNFQYPEAAPAIRELFSTRL